MRYIIYQLVLAGSDNFPANRHNDPVYQQATMRVIELGFGGINNDFASEQDALNYISSFGAE